MSGISLQRLVKRFGETVAVKDLSLEIAEGEFISLLGSSGCGKTTVLRSLAGLETPDEGTISIDGQLVFSAAAGYSLPPGKRGIGMVFQSYALWPHLSVEANVAFGLEVKGVPREEQRKRAREVLRLVGIEDLIRRYPSELSGGQQQRVALARAIVTEPRLLLLDEPLSNLDAKLRLQMRAELQRLHHQLGCTVIYVTHDQLEAMTLSTRVVLLRQGLLQQVDTPRAIYRHPANSWVADFVGNPGINFLGGSVGAGGEIELDCGLALPMSGRDLPRGRAVKIGLRPEDLQTSGQPGSIGLTGQVHSVQPVGNETFVQIRMGQDIITVRVPGEIDWTLEREVSLWVDGQKMLVFAADSGELLANN